ncbi:MAG: DMT family transporter [Gemmatimonadaceae bacterium]|nr:DMT family transporter [Gemmatimonadaceae bacterium]
MSAPSSTTAPRAFGTTDLLLVLMATIWGVNFSVMKYATRMMEPLAFNGVRLVVGTAALMGLAWWRRETRPSVADQRRLMALGVIGHCIYQLLFVTGLSLTRAGNASLMIAASPAFIGIAGRIAGIERLAAKQVIGIACSILGLSLVVLGSATGHVGDTDIRGDLLVLTACVAWAAYTVLLKPMTHRIESVHVAAYTLLGGTIPLALIASPAIARAAWTSLPLSVYGALAYSGIVALVLAYLFWYRGVRVLGPTRTAMYANLQPVIAMVVAWLVLAEVPTAWQVTGGAAVIGGLLLSRR